MTSCWISKGIERCAMVSWCLRFDKLGMRQGPEIFLRAALSLKCSLDKAIVENKYLDLHCSLPDLERYIALARVDKGASCSLSDVSFCRRVPDASSS
jgi:hypothetical protein